MAASKPTKPMITRLTMAIGLFLLGLLCLFILAAAIYLLTRTAQPLGLHIPGFLLWIAVAASAVVAVVALFLSGMKFGGYQLERSRLDAQLTLADAARTSTG